MLTEPKIIERASQPCVTINLDVSQPEISQVGPPLPDEVAKWCKAQGIELAAAPFFDYCAFLPDGRMTMRAGFPVKTPAKSEGRFVAGELPGGRYASLTHTGPYHELHDANMTLDDWVRAQGLDLAGRMTDAKTLVGATRLEIYHKDPGEDPSGHPVTEVAFRLK
ncbi:GyrI-like domain-containing protein [Devosia sp.]|jgi:effector-binding domain-containing protein|uniref:GyrI-like domain-containing protein n=1 Tax=Devosia sp. TaxID=1871048 RepID=UPI0037C12C18